MTMSDWAKEEVRLARKKEAPEVWDNIASCGEDGSITYQCRRTSGLFKTVHPDGTISYSDVDLSAMPLQAL